MKFMNYEINVTKTPRDPMLPKLRNRADEVRAQVYERTAEKMFKASARMFAAASRLEIKREQRGE